MSNIKYTAIKRDAYEAGRIYIAPDNVFVTKQLAEDRAVFGADAYQEDHIVLELRPVDVRKAPVKKTPTARK